MLACILVMTIGNLGLSVITLHCNEYLLIDCFGMQTWDVHPNNNSSVTSYEITSISRYENALGFANTQPFRQQYLFCFQSSSVEHFAR